jgi:hypothetical protein
MLCKATWQARRLGTNTRLEQLGIAAGMLAPEGAASHLFCALSAGLIAVELIKSYR